jgi:FkbM family methyltransferase
MSIKHRALKTAVGAAGIVSKLTASAGGTIGRTFKYEVLRTTRTHILCGNPRNELYVVNTKDSIIGRELFVTGEFDFAKFIRATEVLLRHRAGWQPRVLIDVGANIGTICIPAVRRGYVERAIAIEPDPENCRLLRANLELNGLASRVVVHEAAAGAREDEELELQLSDYNLGDHRIYVPSGPETSRLQGRKSVKVKSRTLNTLCAEDVGADLLVWMDIQGAEGFALAGADALMQQSVPMVLEFWPEALARSGSFPLLQVAVANYSGFVDLAAPDQVYPISRLNMLLETLGAHGTTDIAVF